MTTVKQSGSGNLFRFVMAIDSLRRNSIVEALKRSDLAAMASLSPTEVLLLTGYCPVLGQSLAVFTREGGSYCIVPEDELELAKKTSDAEFIPYQPATLDKLTSPAVALIQPTRELFGRVKLSSGEVGTDLDAGMTAMAYQSVNRFRATVVSLLHTVGEDLRAVSADGLLARLRSVKTPIEIERIRHASKLALKGFKEASEVIAAGRREDEVVADIEAAFSRIAHDGFERGRGYFFCMSGPNSAKAGGAYARTRRRVLEKGDLVMIHANTFGDGYWTDITRTFVVEVERPTQRQQHMEGAIAEARSAALRLVSPGIQARAVDAAARGVLVQHGFGAEFSHPTGHGVGFAAADPNALPRIHPKSPDVLQAGMTFNIEPAIYCEGMGGMRHCDLVACSASGADVLTNSTETPNEVRVPDHGGRRERVHRAHRRTGG
jgi:Xaa-Pro aminopeptidase